MEEGETRVNTPQEDFADGDSVYHDATRINSIDLEVAVKEEIRKGGIEGKGNEEQRKNLLRLVGEEDPLQWSNKRKWTITILMGMVYLNSSIASSIATGATQVYVEQFDASLEVSSLVLSMYLVGFCLGPILWGPFSEIYGRKLALMISLPCFLLFNIGCALSNNMATLLVLRVFAGFFGACPQSNSGAAISDMWAPKERLWPMFSYTLAAFGGPVLGPSSGGFLTISGNWRWLYYLIAIYSGLNFALVLLLQRESYVPLLHRRKAALLRKQGHPDIYAPVELEDTGYYDLFRVHVLRPLNMLFTELPLAYAAAWSAFVYCILFIFFEAYPVIFVDIYGFNIGEEGLAFFGLGVGMTLSIPIVHHFNKVSLNATEEAGGKAVPEARLQQVMLSAPLLVVGFFWFGWTSRPTIHWIVPIIGSLPIGASLILSFNALNIYAAQCYHVHAASALGALAISRCFVAIFVPLFARQMFEHLGPGWASSILGFVSLASIPIPIIFYRLGSSIRRNSRMAIDP